MLRLVLRTSCGTTRSFSISLRRTSCDLCGCVTVTGQGCQARAGPCGLGLRAAGQWPEPGPSRPGPVDNLNFRVTESTVTVSDGQSTVLVLPQCAHAQESKGTIVLLAVTVRCTGRPRAPAGSLAASL